MYLYKISVHASNRSGADSDLVSKILHNWRTHYRHNVKYTATLANILLFCLPGTYMKATVTELTKMLQHFEPASKCPPNFATIISKNGYTSLAEVEKLSKTLKLKNSMPKNIVYDLRIHTTGDYWLSTEYATYTIGSRTLEEHVVAINASAHLAKLDSAVFKAVLSQTRDNELTRDSASYASRNSRGTVVVHRPVTAETCMIMGYSFYADKSATWAVYYERFDGRFRILKVEDGQLSDSHLDELKAVVLVKPEIILS
ncbi:hypothetical protein INT43_004958 [Umbelopsis isabellina]|uniref:Uncharacterized protein n=1 Tax=Mortierella isabellina TaxID=91625 RepID=A0A8H7U6Y3_MORIS|nr:hypothetical protein INT43_004958 [Umbelopsis isabellina]